MSTLTLYGFEDADGNESGTFTTMIPGEAEKYARKYRLRVVAMEYEYSESTVVWEWDFTEKAVEVDEGTA